MVKSIINNVNKLYCWCKARQFKSSKTYGFQEQVHTQNCVCLLPNKQYILGVAGVWGIQLCNQKVVKAKKKYLETLSDTK